ncbi:MAG: alpha/beta fold hydrolase [Cyanobacteria bacterium REEB417]|nr:alpha/beta fold hydrolase [Cyanobacteria bacterium REEB417]
MAAALASLLVSGTALPLRAAEVLQVQLDGLSVPIDLKALEAWSRDPARDRSELGVWLGLLDQRSRSTLVQLLREPFLRDQSLASQLLNSWTGEPLINEIAALLSPSQAGLPTTSAPEVATAGMLRRSLDDLLSRQRQVTLLELLRTLPAERVSLKLDGVIELAQQWRRQLELQQLALRRLDGLGLPQRQSSPLTLSERQRGPLVATALAVNHRREPLPLQIWPSQGRVRGPWILLMPGLGGSSGQLSWLAASLAQWGWPVVVLDHPGSNEAALQASLIGQQPPPGSESLAQRLADGEAVLQAQRQGQLPALGAPAGAPVVLMGHSLGGLTALMAAGLTPEDGLGRRCRQALRRLPLSNLSRLLQCQLPQGRSGRRPAPSPGTPVAAIVAYNGFGSLLWPSRGLEDLKAPLLLVGGSLDLITPPLVEQLAVFSSQSHPRSRLVLLEGGSHFSPVRVPANDQALFRLGDDLVGIEPRKAQSLLLLLTLEFLKGLEQPLLLSPQVRKLSGVRAHVLDPPLARRWGHAIRTQDGDPARPPARRPTP